MYIGKHDRHLDTADDSIVPVTVRLTGSCLLTERSYQLQKESTTDVGLT
jgi:hypothetical protein